MQQFYIRDNRVLS